MSSKAYLINLSPLSRPRKSWFLTTSAYGAVMVREAVTGSGAGHRAIFALA
jgi:hypothetical protein